MQRRLWVCGVLCLLAAPSAVRAEIISGVMGVTGAEMG
jgi:hypothetical protein